MLDRLQFAERLAESYTRLAAQRDRASLLGELVARLAHLTDCELGRVYGLDNTGTRLELQAEQHLGALTLPVNVSVPSEYEENSLLQYCLSQNRMLALSSLDPGLHDTAFLPEGRAPWHSLLCVPLLDNQQHPNGLLVCASSSKRELNGFAEAFRELGSFAVNLASRHAPIPVTVEPNQGPNSYGLIGESPAMQRVYQLMGRVLPNSTPVLVTGETGTGKELVAQAIHDHGIRRHKPFIAQNCASLPEQLLETELFGHKKGAFTGADRDRQGLFDAADGGTLFLDEIGDMPLLLQAKLLRVLQEKEVRPLGATHAHKVDVRIIAATHQDLRARIASGHFREDLFYRLATFPIELPPLRHRESDIALLAKHLSDATCREQARETCYWSRAALDLLGALPYPGNVRELQGMVTRAVLLSDGLQLQPEHFAVADAYQTGTTRMSLREQVDTFERSIVYAALRSCRWSIASTAEQLQIPLRTLHYRMKKLDVAAVGE